MSAPRSDNTASSSASSDTGSPVTASSATESSYDDLPTNKSSTVSGTDKADADNADPATAIQSGDPDTDTSAASGVTTTRSQEVDIRDVLTAGDNATDEAVGPYLNAGGSLADAKAAVTAILAIAGITQVLSIDDVNDTAASSESDLELVVGAIRTGVLSVEAIAAIEALRQLVSVNDTDEESDLLSGEELIETLISVDGVEQEELELLSRAAKSAASPPPAPDHGDGAAEMINNDMHRMSELDDLFEPDVLRRITLSQWEQESSALLEDQTPKLLLFDRDFSAEGRAARAGEKAIGDVIAAQHNHVYCAMLTHSATNDEQERALAETVASDNDLKLAQVVVVAKSYLRDAPQLFARKLKTSLLVRQLVSVRDGVLNALQTAAAEVSDKLKSLDAYTLSGLVEAAVEEGMHDADNLIRLAGGTTRRAVRTAVAKDSHLQTAIASVRLMWPTAPSGSDLRPPPDVARHLHEDRFDSDTFLTEVFAPIEPGDIFQTLDPHKLLKGVTDVRKTFILLSQHCDLMVRRKGTRNFEPSVFTAAPIAAVPTGDRKASDEPLLWFNPGHADGGSHVVRLGRPVHVLSRAVDACAMSGDGSAVLSGGASAPEQFTVGWQARFAAFQDWLAKTLATFRDLEKDQLSSRSRTLVIDSLLGVSKGVHEPGGAIDLQRSQIAFGLRRIGRLTDSDTRVLLAQANDFAGRPAAEGPLLTLGEPASAS